MSAALILGGALLALLALLAAALALFANYIRRRVEAARWIAEFARGVPVSG